MGGFFNKFSQHRNHAVFPALQQRFMETIPLKKMTLDVDSSVIVRYGSQQGVTRGYNPGKLGRDLIIRYWPLWPSPVW